MSKISQNMEDHDEFIHRIKKTLYYGKYSPIERLSLPVTEMASELFSKPQSKTSLKRLYPREAASISYNACATPCSFVLAVLYLERLKCCNPEYLQTVAPRELFLISLLVSSKILYDNGEADDVIMSEWATSGNIPIKQLLILEKEFLNAINWNLWIEDAAFFDKLTNIETNLALKEGQNRGFFTYTEMYNLINHLETQYLLETLSKLVAILATAYLAAVLAMVASVAIVSCVPGNALKPATVIEEKSFNVTNSNRTYVNAADVLKTGIILASITSNYTMENDNVENVSWEWWKSSTLSWLSETSMVWNSLKTNLFMVNTYTSNNALTKLMELDEQLKKDIETRIQDQLEQSWHEEWIDTNKYLFNRYKQRLFAL